VGVTRLRPDSCSSSLAAGSVWTGLSLNRRKALKPLGFCPLVCRSLELLAEGLGRFERILGVMPSRTVRWFALALVAFLFAQPISALAFTSDADGMSCCKDGSMKCCRRSHGHTAQGKTSGPAFSSRDCCGGCQVAVRKSQPVAEMVVSGRASTQLGPAISPTLTWLGWTPSARHDAPLFERPPPSLA
jgi:hypothetical protein